MNPQGENSIAPRQQKVLLPYATNWTVAELTQENWQNLAPSRLAA